MNKALPLQAIKNLPENLEKARWFYDSKHQNLLAVFDVANNDRIGKSVVVINFQKKKEIYNTIVTSGMIPARTLGMDIYREIKDP